jgi:hypothetical protein
MEEAKKREDIDIIFQKLMICKYVNSKLARVIDCSTQLDIINLPQLSYKSMPEIFPKVPWI